MTVCELAEAGGADGDVVDGEGCAEGTAAPVDADGEDGPADAQSLEGGVEAEADHAAALLEAVGELVGVGGEEDFDAGRGERLGGFDVAGIVEGDDDGDAALAQVGDIAHGE